VAGPLVVVFETGGRRDAQEHALVLTAVGIDHELWGRQGDFRLLVHEADVPLAVEQLKRFEEENTPAAVPGERDDHLNDGIAGGALWVAALALLYIWELVGAFGLDWMAAGEGDAALLAEGEWWRTVTALGLHSGLPHLVGNLFFGAIFVGGVCQLMGTGRALLTLLIGGALGNALAAQMHPLPHVSIGASTAVFAAIGQLAVMQWRRRTRLTDRPFRRWTPLVVGVILLGYLGFNGERTDVLAHIAGFGIGALLGAIPLPHPEAVQVGRGAQWVAGLAALALVSCSWWMAFATA
jgi:membrane associated rhomboid family serine protease